MVEEKKHDNRILAFDLVAFDLDGTLLDRDLTITEASVAVLQRLRERGVRLVIATGRPFETAREHAGRLGFGDEDPVICYGGSMVRRMNGETLLHHTICREASLEALLWAEERGLHARILLDGEILVSPEPRTVLERMRAQEGIGVSVVGSLSEWLRDGGGEPTKLVLVDRPDEVSVWLREAQEAFAGRLFVTRSLPHYVEIGSPRGTKSGGLEFLCGHWGLDPERTLAFGDADNDADMLRFAGHGVAVGGMTEGVRQASDVVARPVGEDGVARYVEKLLGDG
ncbi:MAG: HAD family phosphatase [Rubrobacter sp.]|nr:HAD family phosphatase [Rubrobacter sp.]